jgi:hypothetical protein
MSVNDLVAAIREDGIDVHPDHIRNIELGHKQPSPKLLGAMARALHVPKHVLMGQPGSVAPKTGRGEAA